ncbi:hypothetical protein [Streptomyces sp. NPDC060184]|uniref:hypothetical protein n=1 Tax=Streptomyces sp. NPDC060184 TaxID=3347064 RepID=UPI003656207F
MENDGEASAVFCWVFLLPAFTGPGAAAADRLLRRGPDHPADAPGSPGRSAALSA